jgi:acyl carrier protein
MNDKMAIKQRIISCVEKKNLLEGYPLKVTDDWEKIHLIDNVGLDSLSAQTLATELENEFFLTEFIDIEGFSTMNDYLEAIEKLIREKEEFKKKWYNRIFD